VTETMDLTRVLPHGRPEDLECFRCAYNVRGLGDDGQCPECAAPIGETLRRDAARRAGEIARLEASDPRWLRRLALGCGVLLVAMLGVIGSEALTLSGKQVSVALGIPILLSPFILITVGMWLMTTREPHSQRGRRVSLRMIVRCGAIAWPVLLLGMLLSLTLVSFESTQRVMLALAALFSVITFCFFLQLARLATRLPSAGLRGFAIVLALGALVVGIASPLLGVNEVEVDANTHHMTMSLPVVGDAQMMTLLISSLIKSPRFDRLIAGQLIVSLVSACTIVAMALFFVALRRAEARSREPADVTPAGARERTAASSRP
jgi:hypothetical protein